MARKWAVRRKDPARQRLRRCHPPLQGRDDARPMGHGDDIAPVFAFLASDDACYITGQTLYACGGLTLFGDFKNNWAS